MHSSARCDKQNSPMTIMKSTRLSLRRSLRLSLSLSRHLPLTIIAAAGACLVSAANAQVKPAATDSAAPLKLLIWINGDKGYTGLQKVGDAFTKVSGVEVKVQHPEAAPEKFQQAAGAGKGPDIFCWAHDRAGEWAKAGLLTALSPRQKIRDEIEPSSWKAFTYQGKLWGYPIAIETIGLIYNKALVKTPPTNFDEIAAIDLQLKAVGKKAILWDYNKSFFTWPMLAAAIAFMVLTTDLISVAPAILRFRLSSVSIYTGCVVSETGVA